LSIDIYLPKRREEEGKKKGRRREEEGKKKDHVLYGTCF